MKLYKPLMHLSAVLLVQSKLIVLIKNDLILKSQILIRIRHDTCMIVKEWIEVQMRTNVAADKKAVD